MVYRVGNVGRGSRSSVSGKDSPPLVALSQLHDDTSNARGMHGERMRIQFECIIVNLSRDENNVVRDAKLQANRFRCRTFNQIVYPRIAEVTKLKSDSRSIVVQSVNASAWYVR